jgi:hypothetical protein
MNILVLRDYWCLLGEIIAEDAETYTLADASVIRRWGTTAGLGQLAFDGIRKDTILDRQPRTIVRKHNISFVMEVSDNLTREDVATYFIKGALDGRDN